MDFEHVFIDTEFLESQGKIVLYGPYEIINEFGLILHKKWPDLKIIFIDD